MTGLIPPPLPETSLTPLNPTRATFVNTYRVVGLMMTILPGVDVVFDKLTRNALQRLWARVVWLPLSMHLSGVGWLLEEQGELAAYLYLGHGRVSSHINNIGVAPQFRGRGLARHLLGFAEAQASARRLAAVTLAVTVHNTPAVTLYQATGYQPVHHQRWRGEGYDLALRGAAELKLHELYGAERDACFRRFWELALTADGIPPAPLLADQVRHWSRPESLAFEVWDHGPAAVGYVEVDPRDRIASLRVLPAHPADATLLRDLCVAAATLLPPWRRLMLDLGSRQADQAAHTLLSSQGMRPESRSRMLMVKTLAADPATAQPPTTNLQSAATL